MNKKFLPILLLSCLSTVLSANEIDSPTLFAKPLQSESIFESAKTFKTDSEILPAKEAFGPDLSIQKDDISVSFNIQNGYYLYKDKLSIKVNGKNIDKREIDYPNSYITKNDSIYGNTLVYENSAIFSSKLKDSNYYSIEVDYQGCSEKYNICYPLEKIKIENKNYIHKSEKPEIPNNSSILTNDASYIKEIISSGSAIPTILTFFFIGMLLSFSPCVFPTLPLISALIVGDKKKGFRSSIYYGMGFICSYALIGLSVDIFSSNIQILIQKPIFIYISALLFLILGLLTLKKESTFTFNRLNNKLNDKINNFSNGGPLGIFTMGFISSLILSPCAVAPLGATLLFISQENKLFYGMLLLSVLAFGMILPLLIMATFIKKIIPKSGTWLLDCKKILAFILFGFSLYTLSRFIEKEIYLIMMIFLIGTLIILMEHKIFKILILATGLSLTYYSLPLKQNFLSSTFNNIKTENLENYFSNIDDITELNNLIKKSENENKELIVYVGASWCVSCEEMKHTTFSNIEVINQYKSSNKNIGKVDISDINDEKKAVLKKYNLEIAPYFVTYKYDLNKKLIIDSISVGYMDSLKIKKIL